MYAARKALRRKEKSCGERERERDRQTERGEPMLYHIVLYIGKSI